MELHAVLDDLYQNPAAGYDAAEVALHLARDEYPDLDVDAYLSEIAGMAHEAQRYVRGSLESRVNGLCRYLFHEMGFRGNTQKYYDARNSYLNQVLDRRTGIPISLSLVALAVGVRAGLEVVGVGLPGHFVAKAVDGGEEILFDPFHGGRVLTSEQCEVLVEQVTGVPFRASPRSLEAMPLGLLVQRMLTNLKGVYLRDGDLARAVRVIERLCQLNPHNSVERRDLGITLLNAGQSGKAIDHLAAYLGTHPHGNDAPTVREMLARARGDVARWN